jgi:hypothetical protein
MAVREGQHNAAARRVAGGCIGSRRRRSSEAPEVLAPCADRMAGPLAIGAIGPPYARIASICFIVNCEFRAAPPFIASSRTARSGRPIQPFGEAAAARLSYSIICPIFSANAGGSRSVSRTIVSISSPAAPSTIRFLVLTQSRQEVRASAGAP